MAHVVQMTRYESRYAGHDMEAFLCPADVSGSGKGATLDRWNLTIPGQAMWSRFTIMVCNLRPIEGVPAAVKEHPAHTHELTVFAVSPELAEDKFKAGETLIMSPCNHVVGFTLTDDPTGDDGANWLAAKCAEGFIRGMNCVEPGGIMDARERFAEYVRYYAEQWLKDYGPKPQPSAKPENMKVPDPFDPIG